MNILPPLLLKEPFLPFSVCFTGGSFDGMGAFILWRDHLRAPMRCMVTLDRFEYAVFRSIFVWTSYHSYYFSKCLFYHFQYARSIPLYWFPRFHDTLIRRDGTVYKLVRPWKHRTHSNIWSEYSTLYACLTVNLSQSALSINFPVRQRDGFIKKWHVTPLSNARTWPFECPNIHGVIGEIWICSK